MILKHYRLSMLPNHKDWDHKVTLGCRTCCPVQLPLLWSSILIIPLTSHHQQGLNAKWKTNYNRILLIVMIIHWVSLVSKCLPSDKVSALRLMMTFLNARAASGSIATAILTDCFRVLSFLYSIHPKADKKEAQERYLQLCKTPKKQEPIMPLRFLPLMKKAMEAKRKRRINLPIQISKPCFMPY